MPVTKVAVSIDGRSVREIDRWVRERKYPNRSRAVQPAVDALTQRERRLRLALEAAKRDGLDPGNGVDKKLMTLAHAQGKSIEYLESVYANDWRYFATSGALTYKGKPVQGLALPTPILRKIYHDNAVNWFPGISD